MNYINYTELSSLSPEAKRILLSFPKSLKNIKFEVEHSYKINSDILKYNLQYE